MKIPSEIKHKMHMAASHFAKGTNIMGEVDQWFANQKIDEDIIRSGDGISLEEIEYGNDVTEEFCKWFENQNFNKINR